MNWSMSLGTVGRTELKVHATFFLLLAWVAVAAAFEGGGVAALVNVAFIVAIFACVVLHELGHATMARRFGVQRVAIPTAGNAGGAAAAEPLAARLRLVCQIGFSLPGNRSSVCEIGLTDLSSANPRATTGDPFTDSTLVWSKCSCVTSTRSPEISGTL